MRTRAIAAAIMVTAIAACTTGERVDSAAPTSDAALPTVGPPETTPPIPTADSTVATDSAVAAPAVAEPSPTDPPAKVASDGSVVSEFGGQDWFLGTVPAGAAPAPTGEPIVIGMINQENSPIGSFPEMRAAVQAAVAFINAELGGVNGRPLQLNVCVTSFSVEQSQACAQQHVQSGAVAVMSGIDITASGSIPILEQNGIPLVGGVPATLAEMRSSSAFFFSGGTAGAYVGFAADAKAKGATKLAFAYGEFESFEVPAKEYGVKVATSLGLDTQLIPFPLTTSDFLPILSAAVESGADAITVGAADTACVPIVTTLHDLGYTGLLYLTGACAAAQILEQIPDELQGAITFNSEGPAEATTDGGLYQAVIDRYATEPAGGAGTVSFRSAMNLWAAMISIDGNVTAAAISETLRGAADHPSFWGHPYTCDGQQMPGLPSLCAPQQVLFHIPTDGGGLVAASDGWIDVPALMKAAG